jgi:putative lipoic acid-binding regulatory protein
LILFDWLVAGALTDMTAEPSESLLQYPCDISIKVMGNNTADFETLVMELIRPHVPDLDQSRVRVRASRNKRYLSLTVTINATSRAQMDASYQALSDHDQVVMAL